MRPEDLYSKKQEGARIESRVEQVVVLELTPEQAQTIYAVSSWSREVVKLLEEKGASSGMRKVRVGAQDHLIRLFAQLRPVMLKLHPGEIS
jgi:hypothetical protein